MKLQHLSDLVKKHDKIVWKGDKRYSLGGDVPSILAELIPIHLSAFRPARSVS